MLGASGTVDGREEKSQSPMLPLRLACHSCVRSRVETIFLQHHTSRIPPATNMTDLLSLLTELIVHILASCPDIRTTTCPASANKELHAIWLKHTYQILESIVRPQLPAYEDATEVAKLQNSLLDKEQSTGATQVSPLKETPAVRHFNLLLRNATLASNLIEPMKVAIAAQEPENYRHELDFIHAYDIYYFYAKLVLAYRCKDEQLKRALYVSLGAASIDTLHAHIELGNFLENEYRYEEHTLLHGVPIHMDD